MKIRSRVVDPRPDSDLSLEFQYVTIARAVISKTGGDERRERILAIAGAIATRPEVSDVRMSMFGYPTAGFVAEQRSGSQVNFSVEID